MAVDRKEDVATRCEAVAGESGEGQSREVIAGSHCPIGICSAAGAVFSSMRTFQDSFYCTFRISFSIL